MVLQPEEEALISCNWVKCQYGFDLATHSVCVADGNPLSKQCPLFSDEDKYWEDLE